MDDKKLIEELETYRRLGRQDKQVDVASLALAALQKHETNEISSRQKRWAYWISLALPPLGLVFAAKFYFSGKSDGKNAAIVCTVLTVFSLTVVWLIGKAAFSATNVDLNQIQQIKPQDIRDLYQ